jgi:uncharacterized protein
MARELGDVKGDRGVYLQIQAKIKPNSKNEGIEMLSDGTFIIRVNRPPIEGKANERVIELLSQYFKVAKSRVQLVRGDKSKLKLFEIID